MNLPTGIVRTTRGFRAFVRVAPGRGGLKTKRFPDTATLTEIKHWREATRVKHREQPAVPIVRGTLAADVQRYLQLVATMPSLKDRSRDLGAWVRAYGTVARTHLTRDDYRLLLQEWRLKGGPNGTPLAASTVNHRRSALMHLYRVLDGKGAPNPLREIKPFDEPPPEPRDIGLPVVKQILRAMPRSKTRARVKVLAWTGIRGRSELRRMRPEHVDLKTGVCWVPTGKKGKPRHVVLNRAGVAAWKEFSALNAWGSYSKDSLRRSFRRAVAIVSAARKKRKQPPLPHLRVYDLRHTIATALLKAGADLADVQLFLGHTSPRMTRRYAPFMPQKLRAAMRRVG